ncbi:MAG: DUF4296 domain-containing protein [Moheibacter sp.]
MRLINCILICLLIAGCSKRVEEPKHLISENEMIELLSELYIYQQNSYLKDYSAEKTNISEVEAQIIDNHGLSVEDFRENHHYYAVQPEKFKRILKGVKENLESRLSEDEQNRRAAEKAAEEKEKE